MRSAKPLLSSDLLPLWRNFDERRVFCCIRPEIFLSTQDREKRAKGVVVDDMRLLVQEKEIQSRSFPRRSWEKRGSKVSCGSWSSL